MNSFLGIGDWGLGIGDWAQSPIPNPQIILMYTVKFFNYVIDFIILNL